MPSLTHRPLRFCMVTTFYPPYNFGGDGIFIQTLSHELAERGHHIEIIHCKDAYRSLARRDPPPSTDHHPSITVHGLESPYGTLSPLATQQTGQPFFKREAIERILAQGFDVIHFHNISLVGGPQVLALGSAIKLYTTHEYWLVCPTHVLYRYNREVCLEPHCLTCTLSYGRPPQLWRYTNLLRDSVKHVDRFLSPSRFAIEMHHSRGMPLPFSHLPNFAPAPPAVSQPVSQDDPYFLFVGRLEAIKGLQTIIPVFRAHPKARLLIAGKGNYEAELRTLAGDATNIQFLGHIPHDQLAGLYQNALALLVPSLCYEMFPLVILEAFARHTPIIARDLGGLTEIVNDSGGGLLFSDDASLQAAIDRFVIDPDLRNRLGECGYEAYQQRWTPQVHVDRYLEIIEEIATVKQPARVSLVGQ